MTRRGTSLVLERFFRLNILPPESRLENTYDLRRSENTFNLFLWLFVRKQILKHKKIKKTFVPKQYCTIVFYIEDDPTYIGIFPVYLRMDLILIDFQTGSGFPSCAVLEISETSLSQLGKIPM